MWRVLRTRVTCAYVRSGARCDRTLLSSDTQQKDSGNNQRQCRRQTTTATTTTTTTTTTTNQYCNQSIDRRHVENHILHSPLDPFSEFSDPVDNHFIMGDNYMAGATPGALPNVTAAAAECVRGPARCCCCDVACV